MFVNCLMLALSLLLKMDAAEAKRKLGDMTLKFKQQEEDQTTLNTVLQNLTQQVLLA
jgi:hypothetical protein